MEDLEKSLSEAMETVASPYLQSDDEADATLHKIQRLERGKAWAQKLADEQIAKVNAWLEKQLADRQGVIDSLANQLQLYAEERLRNSERKSVSLPCGKFGFRRVPDKIEHDDQILLAFVKESSPQFVKVKKTLDWAGLKKSCIIDGDRMIDENGEVLPGIIIQQQEPKFYVDTKEDEK